MEGAIHSFQSLGAVDGPGVRFVVFMQGCTLRCAYCHNPDTWALSGEKTSVDAVYRKILRYRPYFSGGGGVTVSGGEPLMQWQFVAELFERLRGAGIHTVLDTAGIGDLHGAGDVLRHTDLVLCDLKFATPADYRKYCGGGMEQVNAFLTLTEEMHVPLWIRHVVVPGLTDSDAYALKIAEIASRFSNLQKLELLPFKKLCATKYETLGIRFPLGGFEECSDETLQRLYGVIGKVYKINGE